MGTWEMLEPITHLAEAAGIREGINADESGYSPYGFCYYVSAAHAIRPHVNGTLPLGPIGQLYCCVRGDKYIVTSIATHDLDWTLGPHSFDEFFEDFDERDVQKAAQERPDLVEEARKRTIRRLERNADRQVFDEEEHEENTRTKSIEMRPAIARFLLLHGPATAEDFRYAHDVGGSWEMAAILASLEKQGFLEGRQMYDSTERIYGLSDEATELLACYEPIVVPEDSDGKILTILADEGPKSTRELAAIINRTPERVRSILRTLVASGAVVAKGRGPARRYLLSDEM